MLVSLKSILKIPEAKKCAIGSFNTPNLEGIMSVIEAAQELNQPAIISHAQLHEEIIPLDIIGPIMVLMADKATVPICVHLDHGTSLDYLKKALDMGFTSVMYDGSELSYETNYANTCIAVEMTKRYGASVEAEIGSMGARETSIVRSEECVKDEGIYTDPEVAKQFVESTGIDALACAFGTVHGFYTKKPKLDFELLEKINSLVNVPLVMHGGSGVSLNDYKKAVSCGIRKINYYTYMAKAGGTVISDAKKDFIFYHDIASLATGAMKNDVKGAISVFSGDTNN